VWSAGGTQEIGVFGSDFASGDVDGDGFSDLVTSEPLWEARSGNERVSWGRTYVPDGCDP
jgi:hypothetical protein